MDDLPSDSAAKKVGSAQREHSRSGSDLQAEPSSSTATESFEDLMTVKVVRVGSGAQFKRSLKRERKLIADAQRRAMVKTAQFGVTATQMTIRQTKPKPIATGTYTNSLQWSKSKDGARVGFSAFHAIFVEVGRRRGKQPPVDAILEWVRVKRLVPQEDRQAKKKKSKSRFRKLFRSRKKKSAATKSIEQAQRAGGGSTARQEARKGKRGKLQDPQLSLAWAIAIHMKKKGWRGRKVMLRTMPEIRKRAIVESKKAVKKALSQARP